MTRDKAMTFADAKDIVRKKEASMLFIHENWGHENDKFFYVHTQVKGEPSYAPFLFLVDKETGHCQQVGQNSKEEKYFLNTPCKEIGKRPKEPPINEDELIVVGRC